MDDIDAELNAMLAESAETARLRIRYELAPLSERSPQEVVGDLWYGKGLVTLGNAYETQRKLDAVLLAAKDGTLTLGADPLEVMGIHTLLCGAYTGVMDGIEKLEAVQASLGQEAPLALMSDLQYAVDMMKFAVESYDKLETMLAEIARRRGLVN